MYRRYPISVIYADPSLKFGGQNRFSGEERSTHEVSCFSYTRFLAGSRRVNHAA